MKKSTLAVMLLFLVPGIACAQVYRWVDKAGNIHYGDRPPTNTDSQSITIPPPKVQEPRPARSASGMLDEKPDDTSATAIPEQAPLPASKRTTDTDMPACFSSLTGQLRGHSPTTSTPDSPAALNKLQQKTLKALFDSIDTLWYGVINDVTCKKAPADATAKEITVKTALGIWDTFESRFILETDSIDNESGVSKRLVHQFLVGDALYFTDMDSNSIALEGNRVELISLGMKKVSFLARRHILAGTSTRKVRTEVRTLEIAGKTLKLTELYYHSGMLGGARTWTLTR